jgi:putative membrane protein
LCQRIFNQLKAGAYNWTSTGLRIWNEVATLLLVAIVFLVVLRDSLNWIWGTIGFFGVAIGLMFFSIFNGLQISPPVAVAPWSFIINLLLMSPSL